MAMGAYPIHLGGVQTALRVHQIHSSAANLVTPGRLIKRAVHDTLHYGFRPTKHRFLLMHEKKKTREKNDKKNMRRKSAVATQVARQC